MDTKYRFLIGSGWFSDVENKTKEGIITNDFQKRYGGPESHKPYFSKYWLSHILLQTVKPTKICILDANSPNDIHDKVKLHHLVEISRQIKNFGHAISTSKKNMLCGWARSFIYGATQAYINDLDYIYVEQDLILFGENFIKNIFDLMEEKEKQICYLTGEETPQPLQQSFVAVKHSYLPYLISHLINCNNNKDSEETKHYNIVKSHVMWCPYKGGRQRHKLDSINFCLQHMSYDEINRYRKNGKLKDIL